MAARGEAAFARALATDLGFDDWAEKIVNRALAKASSQGDRGLLLLARCDVRKFIAQRATDPASRLEALGAAGEAYAEFLSSNPPASLANKAHTNLSKLFTGFKQLSLNENLESPLLNLADPRVQH